MRRGDIVQLLADQPLAPPLPDARGTVGEVLATPPALWTFKFPGYYAGPVRLEELRVLHGPRAWVYRARRFYHAHQDEVIGWSAGGVVAVGSQVAGAVLGGVPGAVIGGVGGLLAGGAVTLAWSRLIAVSAQARSATAHRRRR